MADDKVGLAVLKYGVDVFQHVLIFERFEKMANFNHDSICVKNTSENRISTLEHTTASVEAFPTSTDPPSTVYPKKELTDEILRCQSDEEVKRLGIAWGIKQCKELMQAGVPSLHFYALGAADSVKEIAEGIY